MLSEKHLSEPDCLRYGTAEDGWVCVFALWMR